MKKQILLLLAFAINFAQAQTFSVAEVKEDAAFLIKSIEDYNPALDAYNPMFEEKAQKLVEAINGELDLKEHFALVSQIVCFSNEGHFGLGNWKDTVHKGFLDNSYSYLPLKVQILGKRAFVWANYSESDELKKGDEILTINDQPVSEIISQLFQYIPSDGNIESYQELQLTYSFNWMYYLFIEQAKSFNLGLKRYEVGTETQLNISAITRAEMGRNYKSKNSSPTGKEKSVGTDEVFENTIHENYALLTLKTFNRAKVEKHKIKASKLFKSIFKEYQEKRVANLIIDLRNNSGGRKEFPNGIIPFILEREQKGIYQTATSWKGKEKEYKLPSQNKYAFRGKIYVLVNRGTYSAASTMARYLKEYGNTIIIGEETGTRYEGFAAGSEQIVFLPHSGFRISIPRYWKKFPPSEAQETENRGLIPTYYIRYTIKNLVEERDLEMEKAIELIQKG